MDFIIRFINLLVNFVIDFINSFISFLPDSPINLINLNFDNLYLEYLNWLIPINQILQILAIYGGVYVSYLAIAFILRFFKVIK